MAERDQHYERIEEFKQRLAVLPTAALKQRLSSGVLQKGAAIAIRELLEERDMKSMAPQQSWSSANTWCDTCEEADLGISEAREIRDADEVFVEGRCSRCGTVVRSRIVVVERRD